MKTNNPIYVLVFMLILCHLSMAQDGYWSRASMQQDNTTNGNGNYSFDLVFSGTLQYTIAGRQSPEYVFSIHVNSADGTWVLDQPVALINGYRPSADNREFRFHMFYPDGTNRQYFFVTDADEGENPYQYIGAKNIAAGNAAQRSIINGYNFEQFRLNASKTPAESHSVFGPQTRYVGEIEEQEIIMHISNRHAPYVITPSMVGFMVGIFQDDVQRQNRYITYYKTPNLEVKLNRVVTENYIVDATAFEGMDIETYDPVLESEEETQNREALLERYNNRLDQIYSDLTTIEDAEINAILGFETQLLAFNIQKASLNQLSNVIPDTDINRFKTLMRQILERSSICEDMPRYPEAPRERCNSALGRLEKELAQGLQRFGFQMQ